MARAKKAKTTKKKAAPKPPEQPKCEICGRPLPYQGERFCPLHAFLDIGAQYAEEQEKRGTVFGHLAANALRAAFGVVDNAYEQEMHKKAVIAGRIWAQRRQAQRAQQAQQQQQQAAQQQQVDPFAVLGLDRTSATVETVRARQRELARIFHTDLGGGPAAEARLAEFNAAADEAVKILQG